MAIRGDFKAARAARKAERAAKLRKRRKWLPFLQVICEKYGIQLRDIPNGYQFRTNEYIINWWPASNRIVVQYPGSGESVRFAGTVKRGEPKILAALRQLIRVTKGEELSESESESK